MTPTLTKIIEDWIGEDESYGSIVIPDDYFFVEKPDYLYGYNQALAYLRSRVPELEKTIEKLIQDKVGDAIEEYNEQN